MNLSTKKMKIESNKKYFIDAKLEQAIISSE